MRRAVICFTRVPRPGVTKTRLLPVLSPKQCAALHTAFLKDLARVYRELDAALFVAYAPDPDWALLKDIFLWLLRFFPRPERAWENGWMRPCAVCCPWALDG